MVFHLIIIPKIAIRASWYISTLFVIYIPPTQPTITHVIPHVRGAYPHSLNRAIKFYSLYHPFLTPPLLGLLGYDTCILYKIMRKMSPGICFTHILDSLTLLQMSVPLLKDRLFLFCLNNMISLSGRMLPTIIALHAR